MVHMDIHQEAGVITRIRDTEETIIKKITNANFIVGLMVQGTPAGIAKIQPKAINQVQRSTTAWEATTMVASQSREDSNSTTLTKIKPILKITQIRRIKIMTADC